MKILKSFKSNNSQISCDCYTAANIVKCIYFSCTGLQRRFRHKVPHSIYINCRSHRLALCVKHLIKDFPVLEEVDCTLLLIFKLFDNSPQKFAVFKDVQDSYAMKELVLVRASATRWLSHGNACVRLIDRYVQVSLKS